jgi:chromosome segregation ATPase
MNKNAGELKMGLIKLQICGNEYPLNVDGDGESIIKAAEKAEETILGFTGRDNLSLQKAAVLTAVDAYSEVILRERNNDSIRDQIKNYVDELSKAREDCVESQRRANDLSKKNFEITKKYADADKQYEKFNTQINEQAARIQELKKQLEAKPQSKAEIDSKAEALNKQIKELTEKLSQKEKALKELQAQNFSEKNARLTKQNEEQSKQIKENGAVILKLQEENEALDKSLKELEAANLAFKQEILDLKSVGNQTVDLQAETATQKQKISDLEKQLAGLQSLINEKDSKAEKMNAVVEELRKENQELWELKI